MKYCKERDRGGGGERGRDRGRGKGEETGGGGKGEREGKGGERGEGERESGGGKGERDDISCIFTHSLHIYCTCTFHTHDLIVFEFEIYYLKPNTHTLCQTVNKILERERAQSSLIYPQSPAKCIYTERHYTHVGFVHLRNGVPQSM